MRFLIWILRLEMYEEYFKTIEGMPIVICLVALSLLTSFSLCDKSEESDFKLPIYWKWNWKVALCLKEGENNC